MKHCVVTYAESCYRRNCSIWTMEVETEGRTDKVLTIEVRIPDEIICQVRGRYNRRATVKEKEIIRRWSLREHLRMGPSI